MVFSVLALALVNCSVAQTTTIESKEPKTKEEQKAQERQKIIADMMNGVFCTSAKNMDKMLEQGGGMQPIVVSYTINGEDMIMVWANMKTQESMVVKYRKDIACAVGAGDAIVVKRAEEVSI